jgi:hypothetical protein
MTRHPADLLSLGFGLFFVAIGLVLAFGQQVPLSWSWVAPVTVIAIGAILIAAGWSRREHSVADADEG